ETPPMQVLLDLLDGRHGVVRVLDDGTDLGKAGRERGAVAALTRDDPEVVTLFEVPNRDRLEHAVGHHARDQVAKVLRLGVYLPRLVGIRPDRVEGQQPRGPVEAQPRAHAITLES